MKITGTADIVTGGASGLGEARHLAGRGAVIALLDFNIDRAQVVAGAISGRAIKCDVTSDDGTPRAVQEAATAVGALNGGQANVAMIERL